MTQVVEMVLNENHKKKSNDQLLSIVEGMYEVLGEASFRNSVIDMEKAELKNLKKAELLNVLDTLKSNYNSAWEKSLEGASLEVKGLLEFEKYFSKIINLQNDDFSAQDSSNASNADFAAELGSIDFATIIGGPLNACVTAQNNASIATADFIRNVGFTKKIVDGKEQLDQLIMVDFSHKKKKTNPDFDTTKPEGPDNKKIIDEEVTIQVPLISIMNVPSLRIENCDIDFNVKLNSVYTKNVSSSFGANVGASGGFGPVKFNVSVSYRRSMSTGVRVEKEYSLGVKVRATNDQLPGGLEQVLGLLAG